MALCALTPSLAQAQLYSWKDANGRLIISDTPKDPAAKTYAVAYVGTGYGVASHRPAHRRVTEFDDLIAEHATRHSLQPRLRPRRHPGGIGLQSRARARRRGRWA